jgi:regulator of replication initiation timing
LQEENKRLRDENERLKERLSEFEASAKGKAIFSELSTNNSCTPLKMILGI